MLFNLIFILIDSITSIFIGYFLINYIDLIIEIIKVVKIIKVIISKKIVYFKIIASKL